MTMARTKVVLFFAVAMGGLIGCAAFLASPESVRIDEAIVDSTQDYGRVFALPERRFISKVVLLGEGLLENFEVQVKTSREPWQPMLVEEALNQSSRTGYKTTILKTYSWETVKKVKAGVGFPLEVRIGLPTDAIRIFYAGSTGDGRINSLQFYEPEGK